MFPASRVSAPEWRVPPGNGETQKGTSFAASVASQETQHSREITRKMVGERFYVLRLPRIHRATSVNTARFVLPSFQPPRLDATLCNRIANKQTNKRAERKWPVRPTNLFSFPLISIRTSSTPRSVLTLTIYTLLTIHTTLTIHTLLYMLCTFIRVFYFSSFLSF